MQRLAEARGMELKRHRADLHGRCPFHDDRTPSLVITPAKNLWHCLGACQAGGTVIDWVMKAECISFHHAGAGAERLAASGRCCFRRGAAEAIHREEAADGAASPSGRCEAVGAGHRLLSSNTVAEPGSVGLSAAALGATKEVILCEALIEALTFWCAGFRNVTASYGVEGFAADHLACFKQCGIERVLIAYDRDEAGGQGGVTNTPPAIYCPVVSGTKRSDAKDLSSRAPGHVMPIKSAMV
jgi:hypothetical protein